MKVPQCAIGTCALVLLAAACSDPTDPVGRIGGVVLHAPTSELRVGSSLQLHVSVLNESGAAMSGGQVTWSSDNTAVATVSASGMATGVSMGTARIRATAGGFSDVADVPVLPVLCDFEDAPAISLGQTRSGTVDGSSACEFIGSFVRAEPWQLELSSRAWLDFEVAAAGYAMDIVVTDRQLNFVNSTGGLSRARLLTELEAGDWIVWIVSWENAVFNYDISVALGPPACSPQAVDALAVGDVIAGSIRDEECLFDNYVPARGWRIDLAEQTRILARLSTAQYNSVNLLLTDTTMNFIALGWSPSQVIQLARTLPEGSYLLWALSFEADEFELSLDVAEPIDCVPPDTVALGAAHEGRLDTSDCQLEDGRFMDGWALDLDAPASLAISMASVQFDAYLILEDSTGLEIAWDDDSDGNLNPRVHVDLPSGRYVIRATSFAPGATGDYELTVVPAGSPGPVAGDGPAASSDLATMRKALKPPAAGIQAGASGRPR